MLDPPDPAGTGFSAKTFPRGVRPLARCLLLFLYLGRHPRALCRRRHDELIGTLAALETTFLCPLSPLARFLPADGRMVLRAAVPPLRPSSGAISRRVAPPAAGVGRADLPAGARSRRRPARSLAGGVDCCLPRGPRQPLLRNQPYL